MLRKLLGVLLLWYDPIDAAITQVLIYSLIYVASGRENLSNFPICLGREGLTLHLYKHLKAFFVSQLKSTALLSDTVTEVEINNLRSNVFHQDVLK